MRVMTKWCEELEGNFSNVEDREEPFGTEDGKENYLPTKKIHLLSMLLAYEKEKINKYMKELLLNNFEHQSSISKEEFFQEFV